MENVTKFLRTAFYVVILFLGVIVLYHMSQRFNSIAERSADAVASDSILYEAELRESNCYIVRAQLIAILMEDLQYDIDIADTSGTYSIKAENYNPEYITWLTLTAERYQQSYIYEEDGKIEKITYSYVRD
ncbi:MAG TPA: hypothetical protein VJ888_05010 [Mobilitalea sp.]|nr:hypothetical protein [Mobilitalea sp.]